MNPQLVKSPASFKTFFTPELIRKQLELLRHTEMMRASGVLLRFLEFVVEETLEGKEFEIKEYTIGVNVFKRPASFKPQTDAIVRINAGRLRRLLKHYYEGPGQGDPVRIDIPRGTYIPTFEPTQKPTDATEQTHTARGRGLTVAVIPFHNVGADNSMDYFADGFGEQLCSALARFQEFAVVAYYSSRRLRNKESDFRAIGKYLEAHYLLTGSVRFTSTHARINVQLVLADDASQIWTNTYEYVLAEHHLFDFQDDVVNRILSVIGSFNGVILQHVAHLPKALRSTILGTRDAMYWFHFYKKSYTPDALFEARCALEESLRADPDYAVAWAVYSELYADSFILHVQWVDNPLEDALRYAQRSLQLDATNQQGYLAMAFLNLLLHKKEETVAAAEACIAVNPHSSGHRGLAAGYMILAGAYEPGMLQLNTSIKFNPHYLWCLNVAFALYYFKAKDFASAYDKAQLIDNNSTPYGPLLLTAAMAWLRHPGTHAGANRLQHLDSDVALHCRAQLQVLILDHALVDSVVQGLQQAGIPVR